MNQDTHNVNILAKRQLPTPREVKNQIQPDLDLVKRGREEITDILNGTDERILFIVGPCSIHDRDAAIEYAKLLKPVADKISDVAVVAMRTYFEKPRTTVGWRGMAHDPHMDGSMKVGEGLVQSGRIAKEILQMGIPTATELIDSTVAQCLDDVTCWAAIGARTTNGPQCRQLTSGLSMPVGVKNTPEGSLGIMVEGIQTIRASHSHISPDQDGINCQYITAGNPLVHPILRGDVHGPNYDGVNIRRVNKALREVNCPEGVMIDCSHANSGLHGEKDYKNQRQVLQDTINQHISSDSHELIGMMIESSLYEGSQKIPNDLTGFDRTKLKYGLSVTDGCLGFKETADLLYNAAESLRTRTIMRLS